MTVPPSRWNVVSSAPVAACPPTVQREATCDDAVAASVPRAATAAERATRVRAVESVSAPVIDGAPAVETATFWPGVAYALPTMSRTVAGTVRRHEATSGWNLSTSGTASVAVASPSACVTVAVTGVTVPGTVSTRSRASVAGTPRTGSSNSRSSCVLDAKATPLTSGGVRSTSRRYPVAASPSSGMSLFVIVPELPTASRTAIENCRDPSASSAAARRE